MLHLDTPMSDSLHSILSAASEVLDRAHAAYRYGNLSAEQIESVFHLRNDLAQLLAKLGDGSAYVGSEHQSAALGAMRCYEQMADSWLTAVYASVGANPRDELTRIAPGSYVVSRKRESKEGVLVNSIPCTNPAVAILQLDQWDAAREGH